MPHTQNCPAEFWGLAQAVAAAAAQRRREASLPYMAFDLWDGLLTFRVYNGSDLDFNQEEERRAAEERRQREEAERRTIAAEMPN